MKGTFTRNINVGREKPETKLKTNMELLRKSIRMFCIVAYFRNERSISQKTEHRRLVSFTYGVVFIISV